MAAVIGSALLKRSALSAGWIGVRPHGASLA